MSKRALSVLGIAALYFGSVSMCIWVDGWLWPLNLMTAAAWTIVTLLFAAPLLWMLSRRLSIPLAILPAVLVFCVTLVPWSSRKVFLNDFTRITPGMTLGEVELIMAPYVRGTGWPRAAGEPGELTLPSSIVFRHQATGPYRSDWGIVTLEHGKVVKTSFSYD